MKAFLVFFSCFFGYSSPEILEDGREAVEPEHLFNLLKEKNYDEFSRLLAIDNPKLIMPRDESDKTDPRYNRDLEHGDFLVSPTRMKSFQGRNAINYKKHPSYYWTNGIVPFVVDPNGYTPEENARINNCAKECNKMFDGCVYLVPYEELPANQRTHYVLISNGNGCWSYMGRNGGQQAMSLQSTGCLSCGTICHEFMHAIGFAHEHSRSDRDNHITMNWKNINKGWESQFDIAQYNDFVLYHCYDICSVMHYPQSHPDLCKPGTNAFDVKTPNDQINCSYVIGYAPRLSEVDKKKVCALYPKKKNL